ncbi:MAG TPA: hypothetical protein VKZ18_10030 [Polyangia bacterium]|nr:hypothetical protein [Polyangia bacterium]
MSHRSTWPARFVVAAVLFVVVLVVGLRGLGLPGPGLRGDRRGHAIAIRGAVAGPLPLLPRPLLHDDADRDGLPDSLEAALAARYAPAVVLSPDEQNRPASIGWLLARVAPAGISADDAAKRLLTGQLKIGGRAFPDEVRVGSGDPRDWVTYVHVYPRLDGGINVQYWFFYPYNEAPLFFAHEGDWEHVTVELDAGGMPRAVDFAEHANNDPGLSRPWREVRRSGDHPIVLSARGTHASYPDQATVSWFDLTSQCRALEGCADPIWRTWEGGGLANVGERGAALGAGEVLAYGGRWGGDGRLLRSRPSPRSPFHQRGFWSAGFDGLVAERAAGL